MFIGYKIELRTIQPDVGANIFPHGVGGVRVLDQLIRAKDVLWFIQSQEGVTSIFRMRLRSGAGQNQQIHCY